jgi:uncharacterized protein YggE
MQGKIAFLGIALLVLCAAVVGNVTAQNEDCKEKLIYVSGTGKVTTSPDQAIISLAVETENADVAVAQQENARKMDAVINALKAAGIAAEDLKTTNYNIIPVTEGTQNSFTSPKVTYYRVTNTLQVTLKDVTRAGEIIDLAVSSGANRVDSLAFTLSDTKQQELRSQALTAAVAQARGDANAVAAAVGKTIVDVKEVNVGGMYVPVMYDYRYQTGAAEKVSSAVPTPVEVGSLDVTATVSITYIIA